MDFNLVVDFENMAEIKSIKRHIEKETKKIDQKFDGIEEFRVLFKLPYHHRYLGNVYQFSIDVSIPGNTIKVSREPSIDGASADIYSLIHNAYEEIENKLDAYVCPRDEAKKDGKHLCRKKAKKIKPASPHRIGAISHRGSEHP